MRTLTPMALARIPGATRFTMAEVIEPVDDNSSSCASTGLVQHSTVRGTGSPAAEPVARAQGIRRVLDPARRIVQAQRQGGEDEARRPDEEEGAAPAEVNVQQAPDHVSERRPDRDRGEEDRKHATAIPSGEIVGEQAR